MGLAFLNSGGLCVRTFRDCLQRPRRHNLVCGHSPSMTSSGVPSLHNGTWFKLICGASFHDAPSIRNLCEIYTAAGVDCIDVAASRAVLHAARQGISAGLARKQDANAPLLMVSINDDTDVHFRKALFEANQCPTDCTRPCETVCPADAIDLTGVIVDRCYGCGRCMPICPIGIIESVDYVHETSHVRSVLEEVDCLEIHTGPGHLYQFERLWGQIGDVARNLAVVAVSFPNLGTDDEMGTALEFMWRVMNKGGDMKAENIWQTDGRPMSGDIGRGTAYKAVSLAKRVTSILKKRGIPGHIQLAGGTNNATAGLMKNAGLIQMTEEAEATASGIAVGGYARKVCCAHVLLLPFESFIL